MGCIKKAKSPRPRRETVQHSAGTAGRRVDAVRYSIVALLGSPSRAASRGTAAQNSWGPLC